MKEHEVKEHEDEVMSSGVISTVTINSSAVDKTGPETFDGGEGKHERVLSEKDKGEDVMVDVVGFDAIADEHVDTGVSLDSNTGHKELVARTSDQDMEDVAGSGEDCDASVGNRVLASEKGEVAVNEENGNALVESRGSSSEKVEVTAHEEELDRSADVEITVASGSNGDVAIIDSLELTEKCLTKLAGGKNVESAILTADLGSKEVGTVVEKGFAENNVFVDPSLVCVNSQSSAAEVVNPITDEVTTDDAQEMIDGDHVVDEKIEKENAVIISSKISEPLTTKNSGSDDADLMVVDEGSISEDEGAGEGGANVHAEDVDPQVEVVKLSEKESFIPAIEVLTETAQDLAYANGVMDKKTGSKIPESLTIVNHVPEEVNSVTPIADTVEDPVVSGMDIGEVQKIDVTYGAEKDQNLKIAANSEVNVKHKLPESSSEPVLISHREEYNKSREPIVYGRRVHVEVPLYESLDVEQKLPESSSPVSDDESLKIETDTEEEEEDDDDEFLQENEQTSERENAEVRENGHVFSLHQPAYFGPPETEGKFSVSDLVWGKVRSHPWWPGQIIDPSNASKKAMKYYKKDCFLVAYFGDHSFAWNNPSVLKPFRSNFSQFKNQTDSEIFKIAIGCALEEVARRVELGLACSCVPEEISKNIECQVVENGGVRKKSSKRHGKDESASVSSFEPDKLMDYVRLLGQFPSQTDQMDLSIAKAQLTSYSHYKGYRDLPEFWVFGDLLEDAPANEKVDQVNKSSQKFENNPVESVAVDAPESVGGTSKPVSSSGLKKRKARASGVTVSNGSTKRRNRPLKSVSLAPSSTPKPSFKVGELIRRAVSQLTGPPSASKSGGDPDDQHADQIVHDPEKPQMEPSVAEMLLQLLLTAQDPMKEHSLYQAIIPFFYERRAAIFSKSLKKSPATEKPESGVKRNDESKENVPKGNDPIVNDPKGNDSRVNDPKENATEGLGFDFDFDFDDVNDSYWTDRIVQIGDDQPLQDSHQNGGVEECQVVEHHEEDHPKPEKRKRNRSNKKQKLGKSKAEPKPEEESEVVRKRRENSATEIVMKFEEGSKFCSGIQLNKMFRRFGPLMESETEVDQAGGRARVVFKKCSDAEVAENSAGRFKIFGSIDVNYEVNYTPLVSYKPLPLPVLEQDPMDTS